MARRIATATVAALAVALVLVVVAASAALAAPARHRRTLTPRAARPIARAAAWWRARHRALLRQLERGPALLFLGDSITARWLRRGKAVWQRYYGRRRAVDFGIDGDETGHLLWRLQHARLRRFNDQVDVAVLMIGTNNVVRDGPRGIAAGIVAIVRLLRRELPRTHVVLLAIFPRGEVPSHNRRAVARASALAFARLRGVPFVHALDIGGRFVGARGRISRGLMPDFVHLTAVGYQRWAEALEPTLARLLCDGTPARSPNPPNSKPTVSGVPRPGRAILDRYDAWTRAAARRYHPPLDWLLVKAVRIKESFNDPNYVSTTGAAGLMQLMPIPGARQHITASYRNYVRARRAPGKRFAGKTARTWARAYRGELLALVRRTAGANNRAALVRRDVRFDARWNIVHGAAHLAADLRRFRRRYPAATRRQLYRMTLAAYYAGPAGVRLVDRRVVMPRYAIRYVDDAMRVYCRLTRGLAGR